MENTEAMVVCGSATEVVGEENEPRTSNSEQVEMKIAQMLEMMNTFTQMVCITFG